MIYLMIGIQGSGKSTFSKAFSRDNNIEIISTDGIRQKNPGIDEKLVWPTVYDLLAEKVRNNEDAIFDATNITPKVRERFFKNLSDRGVSPTVIAYFFDTPVEVCHERVVNRNKKENELFLPPEVVYSYHESLIKPVLDEGFREIRIVRNNEVVETIKPLIPMRNDYCGIMDDRLLKIIESHNHNHYIGYGEDDESILAKELIKREIGNKNAEILFMIGGTSVNKIVIMHCLAGYEAVIACDTGHINVHESGAIEETGHKILTVPNVNGKLDLEAVRKVYHDHCDYHMVKPAMIYISNTTELGTIYNKEELLEIRKLCDELNLLLFIDGARLYSALNSKKCDYDLKFIASISDVFYIGGTKIGAPMGECLVIINDKLKSNILFSVKRAGGMLAKGFINGLIFRYGIEKGIFNDNAKRENELAERLENSLKELGVKFLMNGESNQIFPIVTNTEYEYLTKYIDFELWQDKGSAKVIRLVTSYMTKDIDIEKTINSFKEIRDIEGLKC